MLWSKHISVNKIKAFLISFLSDETQILIKRLSNCEEKAFDNWASLADNGAFSFPERIAVKLFLRSAKIKVTKIRILKLLTQGKDNG